MWQHPALWRHAIVPVILNVLITTAVLVLFVIGSVTLVVWLNDRFPDTIWGWVFEVITIICLMLVAVAASAASWLLLQGILCGYSNSKLAAQVELQLGLRREEMRELPLSYQVTESVRNTIYLLAVNGGCFLLHIVPIIGSVLAICGSLYFDCQIFGRDYLDYPLALRGMRREEKLAFFVQHRMQTLGLGVSVLLLNFVPLIGPVFLATAVTGAVLLNRKLANRTRRVSEHST